MSLTPQEQEEVLKIRNELKLQTEKVRATIAKARQITDLEGEKLEITQNGNTIKLPLLGSQTHQSKGVK